MADIYSIKSVTLLSGTSEDDTIENHGDYVTINAFSGDDSIKNLSGDYITINADDGDDYIYSNNSNSITINGGTGNDTIYNNGNNDKLFGGVGDDSIYSYRAKNTSIDAGAGNDFISLSSHHSTNILIKYSLGEGNDIVSGFDADDTLSISGGSYSMEISGDDVIVTVDDGKISLIGAASLSAVNIIGDEKPFEANKWTISGTTAKYGTSSKTLVTVKGVKSLDGLSLSDKVVTVATSSLNKKKVTVTGTGYTLALADEVSTPSTKKAAWSYSSGTSTYKGSYKTAGYKLASNAKSISYSKATTATTLASIKGAKSKTGLSVSGSKITLKKSALKNKVTISGGYEFDFASNYKTATITGSAKADTITTRGANISIDAGAGDDTIKLFSKSTVSGGAGADTFVWNKGNVIIADYAAEDKISIASGTAVTSTSGNDLIFNEKVTVSGGANLVVTYYDSAGEHTYKKSSSSTEGVKFTKSGKVATLTDDYEADKFDVADFSNYASKVVSINAAKVAQGLEIVANKKSNVITGTTSKDTVYGLAGADTIKSGAGNDLIYGGDDNDELHGETGSDTLWGGADDDTLYGGSGKDIFVYDNGDGNDIICDYEQGIDKIMILSGEKPQLDHTPLSNNLTFNIGEGSIVVENAIKKTVEFVDANGKLIDKQSYSTAS